MPIWVTAYLRVSSTAKMERADMRETSCSPERPPKMTPNEIGRFHQCCSLRRVLPIANSGHSPINSTSSSKLDGKFLLHRPAGESDEGRQVGSGGAAGVDEEVGVDRADFRPTHACAFQTGCLDQAPGVVPGGFLNIEPILAPGGCVRLRLSGELIHPSLHLDGGALFQLEPAPRRTTSPGLRLRALLR